MTHMLANKAMCFGEDTHNYFLTSIHACLVYKSVIYLNTHRHTRVQARTHSLSLRTEAEKHTNGDKTKRKGKQNVMN